MPDLKSDVVWRFDAGDYVTATTFRDDGALVVVGTGAGDVIALDARTGEVRWRHAPHPGGVLALAWQPRGTQLVTAGQDRSAQLLDGATGRALRRLEGSSAWVEHAAWSPDGRTLATASGKVVRFWTADGTPLLETPPHASTLTALAWSRDGTELAVTCYGGVHFWSPRAGSQTRELPWKGSLISLAWSPDNRVIACGSQDCSVHFWRLATGHDSEMTGYPTKPRALAWDAQSTVLATGGDKTLVLWSFAGKGPEQTRPVELTGHEDLVTGIQFHPRKAALASCARDKRVILWSPRRSTAPARALELRDEVSLARWSPTGDALACADVSGLVALWRPKVD